MQKIVMTLALVAVGCLGMQAGEGGKGPKGGPRGEGGGNRPPPPEGEREGRRGPPPPPLLMVLDSDRDGELSAEEIDAATTALKELDKNGDGKLDRGELRPPMPPREGGREGREGAEGPPPPPPHHPRGAREDGNKSAKRAETNDRF